MIGGNLLREEIYVDNKKIYVVGKSSGESPYISCREMDAEKEMWVLRSVNDCSWWQKTDYFVSVSEFFYDKNSSTSLLIDSFFKKSGFIRGVTFQGFSYEISIHNGVAKYFDFHK